MTKRAASTASVEDTPIVDDPTLAPEAPEAPPAVAKPVYAVFGINPHFTLGSHAFFGPLPEGHAEFMRPMTDEEIARAGTLITQHRESLTLAALQQ